MVAYSVLTVGDGVIEIPEELQNDPRLQKGASVRLVAVQDGHFELEPVGRSAHPTGDWRRLRGSLAHLPVRLIDEMEADKQRELAEEKRMMGGSGFRG